MLLLCLQIFSAAGLVISAIVHASTYRGVDPQAVWPPTMAVLHIGMFAVLVPVMILAGNKKRLCPRTAGSGDQPMLNAGHLPPWVRSLVKRVTPSLKIMDSTTHPAPARTDADPVAAAPSWMKVLCGILFVYAVVNLVLFIIVLEGVPSIRPDGTYALRGEGRKYFPVTPEVYHLNRAREVRGFSGHWMAFYAIGMSAAASARKRKQVQHD